MENKLRTIIISDIHGCISEFQELLKTVSYNPAQDRCILLGDLIDRGPDSVGVVRMAREMNLECVMGNHELKFLKWYKNRNSRSDVLDNKDFYSHFSDDDINYIFKLPSYIKYNNTIMVHGGVKANKSITEQSSNDLSYLRYIDSNGNFISMTKVQELGKEAIGAYFWTEFWRGPESVVYGHHVHSYKDPLIEEVAPNIFCYGLDTGCCFGGRLTALILETKEIVQIQAKETYYKSRIK